MTAFALSVAWVTTLMFGLVLGRIWEIRKQILRQVYQERWVQTARKSPQRVLPAPAQLDHIRRAEPVRERRQQRESGGEGRIRPPDAVTRLPHHSNAAP
jgi:hypothetical protein